MNYLNEIKIIIKFHSESQIPADLVAAILLCVDSSIKESDTADFEAIKREAPQIPPEIIDAVESGVDGVRFKGLYLDSAETGSVILSGVVGGAVVWLLINTIGESVKESWKRTEMHQRIMDILLSKQRTEADEIIRRIGDRLSKEIALELEGVKLDFTRTQKANIETIHLIVHFTERYPAARKDLRFKDGGNGSGSGPIAVGA